MIIIQAPNGNLGSHLIRVIHLCWPEHFQYNPHNNWKNDLYRADLILHDPHVISESETTAFANLLAVPSLVQCSNTAVIPTQLLNQVTSNKIFYLTRSDQISEIKTVFLQWLSNSTNQFNYSTSNQDTVDFYQNLWQQLTVQLLATSPIDGVAGSVKPEAQTIEFADLGTYSALTALLDAVHQEFDLGALDMNDAERAQTITEMYNASIHPVDYFQQQFLDFKSLCEKIIELGDMYGDYRELLDEDQQSKFKGVMDFFQRYQGVWDYQPGVVEKLPLDVDQYLS
jgi:hypothetical protein